MKINRVQINADMHIFSERVNGTRLLTAGIISIVVVCTGIGGDGLAFVNESIMQPRFSAISWYSPRTAVCRLQASS